MYGNSTCHITEDNRIQLGMKGSLPRVYAKALKVNWLFAVIYLYILKLDIQPSHQIELFLRHHGSIEWSVYLHKIICLLKYHFLVFNVPLENVFSKMKLVLVVKYARFRDKFSLFEWQILRQVIILNSSKVVIERVSTKLRRLSYFFLV